MLGHWPHSQALLEREYAQLRCSRSGAWEPENEATFATIWMQSCSQTTANGLGTLQQDYTIIRLDFRISAF